MLSSTPLTEPALVLARYGALINTHNFDDICPLIADDAVFWFGDGSHAGLPAIRAAFEATWRNLVDEVYWLEDICWIARSEDAACCLYRFHWQASVAGQPRTGSGRGTSVFAIQPVGWKIVHEHLSAMPGSL